MISLNTITILTDRGNREIYISLAMLNPKALANLRPGKIKKLFLYDNLKDDRLKANVPPELLATMPHSKDLVINYGQSFDPYFLGELNVDFDKRCYSNWNSKSDQLTTVELKALMEQVFNGCELRTVTIFTPTKPSDINLALMRTT